MGGCYGGSYSYTAPDPMEGVDELIKEAIRSASLEKMVEAYNEFFRKTRASPPQGFIARAAMVQGISDVTQIPKEFDGIEYEVKFDIGLQGKGSEPGIAAFLDAFDFPPTKAARFLKDPVHAIAEGTNHFFGDSLDEKLVVIEKKGGTYLKEKGPVEPLDVGVEGQEAVIKRTEKRYAATISEILDKIQETAANANAAYRGRLRKEKADDFVIDCSDGRIYSFTITRAHLVKPGEKQESGVQRQLEIEYAGHIPGFQGFEKDSEKQIVQGMVDLARYVHALYAHAPLSGGWRIKLKLTGERKYDFIQNKQRKKKARGELPQPPEPREPAEPPVITDGIEFDLPSLALPPPQTNGTAAKQQ